MKTTEPRKVVDLVLEEVFAGKDQHRLLGELKVAFAKYSKWINMFHVDWEDEGKKGGYQFASRRKSPLTSKEPDAVVIVALHVGDDKDRLVATHEYRIPVGDYEWGTSAGLKNPGESVEDCAKRELKEETGLEITEIKEVTGLLYSSGGLTDECATIVFCECTGTPNTDGNEHDEKIKVHLLDQNEVTRILEAKEPISAKVWPIFRVFSRLGEIC